MILFVLLNMSCFCHCKYTNFKANHNWQAGNAKEEESSYGNRKLVKASACQKVDNIHAFLDALYCFNLNEGNIDQNTT